MRFGCCTGIDEIFPVDRNKSILPKLLDAGCDFIETSITAVKGLAPHPFKELLAFLESHGVKCEAFNLFIPASIRLTGRNVNLHALREHVKACGERALMLGGEIIVLGSGGARNIEEGFNKSEAEKQLTEALHVISDTVPSPLVVVIEPLRKRECNIINSLKEGANLVYALSRDNIKLLADYFHMADDNEPISEIAEYGAILRHIHFAEPVSRSFPADYSDAHAVFFDRLIDSGYDARVSLECSTSDKVSDSKAAIPVLRQYCYKRLEPKD